MTISEAKKIVKDKYPRAICTYNAYAPEAPKKGLAVKSYRSGKLITEDFSETERLAWIVAAEVIQRGAEGDLPK